MIVFACDFLSHSNCLTRACDSATFTSRRFIHLLTLHTLSLVSLDVSSSVLTFLLNFPFPQMMCTPTAH